MALFIAILLQSKGMAAPLVHIVILDTTLTHFYDVYNALEAHMQCLLLKAAKRKRRCNFIFLTTPAIKELLIHHEAATAYSIYFKTQCSFYSTFKQICTPFSSITTINLPRRYISFLRFFVKRPVYTELSFLVPQSNEYTCTGIQLFSSSVNSCTNRHTNIYNSLDSKKNDGNEATEKNIYIETPYTYSMSQAPLSDSIEALHQTPGLVSVEVHLPTEDIKTRMLDMSFCSTERDRRIKAYLKCVARHFVQQISALNPNKTTHKAAHQSNLNVKNSFIIHMEVVVLRAQVEKRFKLGINQKKLSRYVTTIKRELLKQIRREERKIAALQTCLDAALSFLSIHDKAFALAQCKNAISYTYIAHSGEQSSKNTRYRIITPNNSTASTVHTFVHFISKQLNIKHTSLAYYIVSS